MKCLQIVQHLSPGGIETMALNLVKEKEIFIAVLEGKRKDVLASWTRLDAIKDKIFFLEKKPGFRFELVRQLEKIVIENQFGALHSHHIGPLIYGTLLSRKHKNRVHVHTEHDAWHFADFKQRVLSGLMFWLNPSIHLVAVSKGVADLFKNYFPRKNIEIIHNATDMTVFKPADKATSRALMGLPLDKTLILGSGRLEKVKGFEYLIEAMALLPSSYHLAIAGRGSQREALDKQVKALNLSERVSMLGLIDNMAAFYQTGDLFCMPSLDEGLPFALLEAQACDLPVVCSDVGGCFEGISPETALLIKPADVNLLAKAIVQLKAKKGVAREFIKEKFSYKQLKDRYYELYESKI